MPLMRGDPDMCNKNNADNAEAVKKLAMLGFPTECPIPEVMYLIQANHYL